MSVLAVIFLVAIQVGYHKWVAPNRVNQPPVTTEPAGAFAPEEQETTEAPTQAPRTGIDMVLTVLQDECWLQIRNEGELLYEGIMSSGQTISYDNLTRLELVAGNPGVTELILNDMNLGALGERGTVARKTYILENGELKEEVGR
jgi:hypothetical protein